MLRSLMPLAGIGFAVAMAAAQPASAQAAPAQDAAVDPAKVPMPNLAFTPNKEDEDNYDKYFYFHRAETNFEEAYEDLRECDAYARGMRYHAGTVTHIPMNYGILAGTVGSALGSMAADAIFGSAERRKHRRINLRTCMGYKEYTAYGLRKELWTKFNFEEGLSSVEESKRLAFLQMQAKVASGAKPTVGEIVE